MNNIETKIANNDFSTLTSFENMIFSFLKNFNNNNKPTINEPLVMPMPTCGSYQNFRKNTHVF